MGRKDKEVPLSLSYLPKTRQSVKKRKENVNVHVER